MRADAPADSRRPLTRACLGWSERRHHLAGVLGAELFSSLLDRGWLARGREGARDRLTPAGERGLDRVLDLHAVRAAELHAG